MAALAAPAPVDAPAAGPLARLGDERLARLAARGNQRAFAAIYARYMPALTGYCTAILRSPEDGEDAAQTAMLQAMDALGRRPAPERLRPWLYRIAHNEAISLSRRRRPSRPLDDEACVSISVEDPCEATAV
ncbi:MAG TPA: RNA polymerase sigma factor, partial [Solirubrobacteraceae bacterium]|nr:RNA polymerase sigma factor [Solirubrobacteraceae bacterium]